MDMDRRKLERYEIVAEIGHGGMATVYRARDTRLDRLVALKILHPHLRGAEEARARFSREAKSVARLRHPNILEIFDYSGEGSEDGYIAAELLTGPTLKAFVEERGPLPAEVAATVGIALASALDEAHRAGIIHRDVKPENVLLHDAQTVKLTDFGIAQLSDSQSYTATGQVLGSPGHMAPEQIEGQPVDARTDIFALGTVLYYLVVGTLPFAGRNPAQILKNVVDGTYVDPLRAQPSMGASFAAIVRRSLNRQADQRYPTAGVLREDLTRFVDLIALDDPTTLLADYLRSAAEVTSSLRARVIERYTEHGRVALRQRRRHDAIAFFDRVLALDDGNEAVLQLVRDLSRDLPRRRLIVGGLGLTTLLMLAYVAMSVSFGPRSDSTDSGALADASHLDSGTSKQSFVGDDAPMPTGGDAGSSKQADNGRFPAGQTDTDDEASSAATPRTVRRSTAPRLVKFLVEPRSVAIGVDGATPQPYGPSFQQIEIAPGLHRFSFQSLSSCCRDKEVRLRIAPGHGPYLLQTQLPFRPAGLVVTSNIPAHVEVGAGAAPGASGKSGALNVPMGGLAEERELLVSADGYRPHRQRVALRAGEPTQVKVQLVPSDG